MRRLLRILLNAATVLSLLACAGVVWLCQTGEIVYWGWRNRNCVFAMYGTLVVRVGEWGSSVASVMALFLTIVVPVLHLEVYHRRWAKARMRPAGLCPVCGYDCRATPDRCPECGTVPKVVTSVGSGAAC
jgi:hypothetical protein